MEELVRIFWLGVALGISLSVIISLLGALLIQRSNRPHPGGGGDSRDSEERRN